MQGGSAVCRNRKQNAPVIVCIILTDSCVWILTNTKRCRFRYLASSSVADDAAILPFLRLLYSGKF